MNSLCSNTILIMKSLNNRVVLGAQASGTTPTTKLSDTSIHCVVRFVRVNEASVLMNLLRSYLSLSSLVHFLQGLDYYFTVSEQRELTPNM